MNLMQHGVPLRFPGAKMKARKLLHSLAPPNYREYREPFLGSGAMLIGARHAERIWLNDKNPLLIRFWEWFRDRDDALDEMVRSAAHFRHAGDAEIERAFVQARARVRLYRDPFSYWFLNRFAVAAIVSLDQRDIASLSTSLRRNGMAQMRRERLEGIRSVLRQANVRLTCADYRKLLQAPGESVWVYLDPPYLLKDTEAPVYEYAFSPKDHARLAHALCECRHAWLLSNGDSPFIRRLYKGFRRRHRRYKGSMSHLTADRWKTELIITNY